MSEWQPIDSAPMNEPILVAYHGHGYNHVAIVTRVKKTGYWGDYDYINSHDGEPKYWMPLPTPPNDIEGPNCGCDGCTEKFAEPVPCSVCGVMTPPDMFGKCDKCFNGTPPSPWTQLYSAIGSYRSDFELRDGKWERVDG